MFFLGKGIRATRRGNNEDFQLGSCTFLIRQWSRNVEMKSWRIKLWWKGWHFERRGNDAVNVQVKYVERLSVFLITVGELMGYTCFQQASFKWGQLGSATIHQLHLPISTLLASTVFMKCYHFFKKFQLKTRNESLNKNLYFIQACIIFSLLVALILLYFWRRVLKKTTVERNFLWQPLLHEKQSVNTSGGRPACFVTFSLMRSRVQYQSWKLNHPKIIIIEYTICVKR